MFSKMAVVIMDISLGVCSHVRFSFERYTNYHAGYMLPNDEVRVTSPVMLCL
jgi:hypothetical protein